MKLVFETEGATHVVDIETLLSGAGAITIGQQCKQVWNAIAIAHPSVDPFQCHLLGTTGCWKLNHGQQRTECPKGLLSSKLVPCNGCTGRCVNITPGRPKYYLRTPATPTLLNGSPVGKWGQEIQVGDEILLGEVKILVTD